VLPTPSLPTLALVLPVSVPSLLSYCKWWIFFGHESDPLANGSALMTLHLTSSISGPGKTTTSQRGCGQQHAWTYGGHHDESAGHTGALDQDYSWSLLGMWDSILHSDPGHGILY
jgi:hypothetical protein